MLALALCYHSVICGMVNQWLTDDDMSHGLAVPFVIGWIVWRERREWLQTPLQPSAWGWALLLFGMALHLISTLGGGLFIGSVALQISIAGAIIAIAGFPLLRLWAFPFLLSFFMLPKLAFLYNQGTLPLQLIASRLAAALLTLTGFGVIRDGNILDIAGHRILVAEACNGIRFLLPLAFFAALIGYAQSPGTRVLLLLASIPLAIVANALRVAAAGAWPAFSEGTLHSLSGLVIFIVTLAILTACTKHSRSSY